MRVVFLQWLHFMDGSTENMGGIAQFGGNTHDCYTESFSYTEFPAEQLTRTAE
jgi:hypothetical protein